MYKRAPKLQPIAQCTPTHARPRVFRESGRVLLMARIVLLCLRDERITVRCPLSEQPRDNVALRAVVNQASFLNSRSNSRGLYSPGLAGVYIRNFCEKARKYIHPRENMILEHRYFCKLKTEKIR